MRRFGISCSAQRLARRALEAFSSKGDTRGPRCTSWPSTTYGRPMGRFLGLFLVALRCFPCFPTVPRLPGTLRGSMTLTCSIVSRGVSCVLGPCTEAILHVAHVTVTSHRLVLHSCSLILWWLSRQQWPVLTGVATIPLCPSPVAPKSRVTLPIPVQTDLDASAKTQLFSQHTDRFPSADHSKRRVLPTRIQVIHVGGVANECGSV